MIKISIVLGILFCQIATAQDVEMVSKELNKYQNLRDFCVSEDGSEAYFSVQSPNQNISQIVCVKNKKWKKAKLMPFSDAYMYLEPFLSYDGKRLYFASNRPQNDSIREAGDFDIWYVERENEKQDWSEPINLGSPVNTEDDEFFPSLAENGNLYLTKVSDDGMGKDDIYLCEWNGKSYEAPVLLSEEINTKGYEFNAFIAKDESFIIYTKYNAADGYGSGDLYISRRNENDEWSPASNLGDKINSRYMEYCPYYSEAEQTLYFTSKRDELEPKKFEDLEEFQDYVKDNPNGLSKLYQYKIKL